LLKNSFYSGSFVWDGKTHAGTQPLFFDRSLFEQVQVARVMGKNLKGDGSFVDSDATVHAPRAAFT
jgi:hypothetical protein